VATLTSPAALCNIALGFVGQRDKILNLTEDTVAAIACATHYPLARDACLEAHWWSWATKRRTLALLTGVERTGWSYVYAAPTDWVSVNGARYLETGGRPRRPDSDYPFLVELNDAGNACVIAADVETPELVYTRAVESVAIMPALFIHAVAAELAVRLALELPVKPGLAQGLGPKAYMALQTAVAADLRLTTRDVPPDAEHVRGR